jgi:hypothetical protein
MGLLFVEAVIRVLPTVGRGTRTDGFEWEDEEEEDEEE